MSAQKNDPGVEMAAREGAEDLLRRLRSAPTLSALAVNPLLLTMIATVHRYRSSLPGRRVELYAEVCEVFLGKRRQAIGVEDLLTPAQKRRVLQPLAYYLMQTNRREIGVTEATKVIAETLALVTGTGDVDACRNFLKQIEQDSGLLLEREAGEYSFAHLSFQEYLAAVHIQEEGLVDALASQVKNPWWHETCRLYGAQADASPIIDACLSDGIHPIHTLVLALECAEEAREVAPTLRQRLERMLSEEVEDADPERRWLVAEALLLRRQRQMVRVRDDLYIDPTYVTYAEYQLFLEEMRQQGKFYQPDHWLQYHFAPGSGRAAVVGVRPADAEAFCQWLTARETEPAWSYRLPWAGELAQYELNKPAISAGAGGYWVKTGDAASLERDDAALSSLSREARDRAFDRDLDRAFDRDLTRDLTRDRDRVLDFDRVLDLDRVRVRAFARDRNLDPVPGSRAQSDGSFEVTRFVVGQLHLFVVRQLQLFLDIYQTKLRRRIGQGKEGQEFQATMDTYLDLYIDYVILEERIEGRLRAFEGIRLVKEPAGSVGLGEL